MATFEIYDAAGTGFSMPASAAYGYVIADAGGTVGALTYDDGQTAIFSIFGNPQIDEVWITYNIQSGLCHNL